MKQCLEVMFGEPIDEINVGEGGFADLMDQGADVFVGSGADVVAATQPNNIYLDIPCDAFWRDLELVLHEYYHVVKQWGAGMSSIDYMLNYGDRERAAKDFAKQHLQDLENCMECGFPNQL